ncbi:MAG TPA: hypothetical protein PLK58_06475 [Candidatus Rifleibacterium sp.]|nr:hypothetical protein [Candidatus Rifleibacterium sp.]
MKKIFVMFLFLSVVMAMTGCSIFGDDDDNSYVGPVAVNAPASAAAFSGVTMSFNPTITLSSDGTTHTFTYQNLAADAGQTVFPDAAGATLSGTYSYAPDSSDKASGQLNFDFAGTDKDFLVTVKNFTGLGNSITSFQVFKVGDTTNTAYPVTIVSGTLAPAPATQNTGGSGTTPATIPDSLKSQVKKLKFFAAQQSYPTGFPYKADDVVDFTFSGSGSLSVGSSYRDLGTPVKYPDSEELVWHDSAHGIYYALSFKQDGAFNEINVYSDPAKKPETFYGQFTE